MVHLNRKALSRREQYVAFSRSDKLENLHIVGNFTDPWFKEEGRRKKKFPALITEDRVRNAFLELEKKEVELIWKPLYKFPKEALKLVFHNVNSLIPHLKDIKAEYSTLAADVCFFLDSRLKTTDIIAVENFSMVDQIVMKNELRVPGGIVIMSKPHINVKICKKVINQADDHYALAFTVMVQDTIVIGVYSSPKCSLSYIKNSIGQVSSSIPVSCLNSLVIIYI